MDDTRVYNQKKNNMKYLIDCMKESLFKTKLIELAQAVVEHFEKIKNSEKNQKHKN